MRNCKRLQLSCLGVFLVQELIYDTVMNITDICVSCCLFPQEIMLYLSSVPSPAPPNPEEIHLLLVMYCQVSMSLCFPFHEAEQGVEHGVALSFPVLNYKLKVLYSEHPSGTA